MSVLSPIADLLDSGKSDAEIVTGVAAVYGTTYKGDDPARMRSLINLYCSEGGYFSDEEIFASLRKEF